MNLQHVRIRSKKGKASYVSRENLLFIKNPAPVYKSNTAAPFNPYVLGLLLGDGSIKSDGSNILHAHVKDMNEYLRSLPSNLGELYIDKRNNTVANIAIKGISHIMRELGLAGVHGNDKFIPSEYFELTKEHRIALLQGLMDTDGSIQKNGRMDFCSNSEKLIDGVSSLVRGLGGTVKKRCLGKAFRIEIWISYNPFRLVRKAERFTGKRVKPLVAIQSIESITDEPSQCIAVEGDEH